MPEGPPPYVLTAFGGAGEPELLPGGQGGTWCVGNLVFKQTDVLSAAFEGETLLALPQIGYRVPRPARSIKGDWLVKGWAASEFLEGCFRIGAHVEERFVAARCFHSELHSLPSPPHLLMHSDPWTIAYRIALGQREWSPNPIIAECLASLKKLAQPLNDPWQVIHSDLSGNFLLADGLAPAIIDFTPKWSPAGMGEAILAVDLATWEGVDLAEVLSLLTEDERKLLPWAAQTRLLEFDTQHRLGGRTDSMLIRQTQDYVEFTLRLKELI